MKISAVIPAYNAEEYIERSVASLVRQSQTLHEIIIIDDGSSDDTVKIVKALQRTYEHIVLLQQANQGASAARNTGLNNAQGDWILFLDADDECAPTLIETYTRFLQENPARYCAVYSQALQVDERGEAISGIFSGYDLHGQEGFVQMLLRNPIISPSGSLVKKTILDEMNGFDTSIKYVEDVDFWLRLLLNGNNIGHVCEPLSFIRRHSSNTTANIESTRHGEKRLLDKFGLGVIKETIYERRYTIDHNHLDYVNFLIRFEKWPEAEQLLETVQIEASDDKYGSYLFVKALVALQVGKYEVAKDLYLAIIKWNNTHGAALNNIGVLYAENNELEKARESFKLALQYYPGYLDAAYNLEQLDTETPIFRFTKRELRKSLLRYS